MDIRRFLIDSGHLEIGPIVSDCNTVYLTSDRCEKLKSIGFEFRMWGLLDENWEQRFQKLLDFKKVNGHTNVRQSFGPIRSWVKAQRRVFQQGTLTSDRCEKVEKIGFTFIHNY